MSLSVDEIERTMNTYHTAWLVCMIAACVFLVAAVYCVSYSKGVHEPHRY